MHSMSGTRDNGGGQLYDGEDAGSVFFQSTAGGVGGDAGGGLAPSYSSITDYLQGLLEPADLARHLDAPPADGESAVPDVIGHDGRQAGGGAPTPVTPNSSMSSEPHLGKKGRPALEEGEEGEIDEEWSADNQNSRDEKKPKKKAKGEKKARGSRVAFATKSEVDHLDDGYRWRKYGQKAVKNSSFPRSYYRCTAARCGVKKQVERSQQDPATVVTTYEGHHAHPSPAAHRGGMATGIYSLATFQQQQHPASPDDLLLAAAMTPPAVLVPRQADHRFTEYYGMQLQDVLLDPAGNQHGHR